MHVRIQPSLVGDLGIVNASDEIARRVFGPRVPYKTASAYLEAAVSSGATGDDAATLLPGMVFRRHDPLVPDIRAGAGTTVTRDAQGYTISAPGGAAGDDTSVMLPNRIYKPHDQQIPDVRAATGSGAGVSVSRDALGFILGVSLTTVEVSLGSAWQRSGSFQITGLAGMTPGKPVYIQQAVGPYTGKGTSVDEVEMDQLQLAAYVLSATVIQVYWNAPSLVQGNFKFNYFVGA